MEPKTEKDLIQSIEWAGELLRHYAAVLKGVEVDETGLGIRRITTLNLDILLGYLKRISGVDSSIMPVEYSD